MEPLEIAEKLRTTFPEEVREVKEFGGQVSVVVKSDRITDIVKYLRDDPGLRMDLLRDLCGVDYLDKKTPRFEVVYHLYSIPFRHLVRLRAEVNGEEPAIDTIVPVHRGADWHERECFDLFGISFRGHPDLRRILLPDDWEGHPLRKDYPYSGPTGDEDYKRYRNVVEKAEENRQHEWYRTASES